MEKLYAEFVLQGGCLALLAIFIGWLLWTLLPRIMDRHREELTQMRADYETSLRTQRHDFRGTMQEMIATHAVSMKEQHDSFTEELEKISQRNNEEHKATRESINKLATALDSLQNRLNRDDK